MSYFESMLDDLSCLLSEENICVEKELAGKVLEKKFEEAIQERDSLYDPASESNDCIIDAAIEILHERYGENVWHEALREAREMHLGSTEAWVFENMSGEVVEDTFEELKAKYNLETDPK